MDISQPGVHPPYIEPTPTTSSSANAAAPTDNSIPGNHDAPNAANANAASTAHDPWAIKAKAATMDSIPWDESRLHCDGAHKVVPPEMIRSTYTLLKESGNIRFAKISEDDIANLNAEQLPKIRVCVISCDYDGSASPMKQYDMTDATVTGPQLFFDPKDPHFSFSVYGVKKAQAYRQVRSLAKSGEFDLFYNMCDGCRDEDIAGIDVVTALEEFNVPFTGPTSKWYELTKPEMKMIAYYNNIRTANYALVESVEEAERKCSLLKFPLLIKHPAYGGSAGMTKDCKCRDMPSLLTRLQKFLDEFQIALIEEFIEGVEVTVLACGDATSHTDGVRVFQPVMVSFPPGEDFKHFDMKWVGFEGMQWVLFPATHPSYQKVIDLAAASLKTMMAGVGYGRCDIRIDAATQEPYFLELNPQPGMMYPPGQEGSSDWIMKLDETWCHRSFTVLQFNESLRNYCKRLKYYYCDFDLAHGYHLRASRTIPKGAVVLDDEGRPQRLFTKPWVEKHWSKGSKDMTLFRQGAWPVGRDGHIYAVPCLEPSTWHSFNHSCEPNMKFDTERSLNCIAVRHIAKGEELTMDYRTFKDKEAEPFDCFCGAPTCCKRVTFDRQSQPDDLLGVSTSSNSGGATPEEVELPAATIV